MDSRFNTLDNTAPTQSPIANPKLNVPRSAFNFSCMRNFNGTIGMLMPFDLIETLPGEDYKISYDVLAMVRNPLTRRLLSGMRIYIHTYYSKCSDLWEGFNTFVTKGRSGDINLQIPRLAHNFSVGANTFTTFTPMSPSDFMGVPAYRYDISNPIRSFMPVPTATSATVKAVNNLPQSYVNSLPFVMYQRIYRDRYMNKNLVQDNKKILPDNEDHFILPYSATEVNQLDYDNPVWSDMSGFGYDDPDSDFYVPNGSMVLGSYRPLKLNVSRFRQFKGDYFNSALPFEDLIRGTAPVIDVATINSTINWDNVLGTYTGQVVSGANLQLSNVANPTIEVNNSTNQALLKTALNKAIINNTVSAQLNLNQFRQLQAYTIFMERNARTDGDYNNLIQAQYGTSPKIHDRTPFYIGGTYQDIVFSEILQTSESTATSPLGTQAGRGVSANTGFIGSFHSSDFGYIMSIMSIVPDTYYTNGISRMLTRTQANQFYFPVLNNLAPQAILNQELYLSGVQATDKDVYGYTERYSEFKSRPNRVSGLIALPHTLADYDASSIIARRFSTTPTLSQKFTTMSLGNVDMSVFTVENEPPFDIQVGCRVDKVSPMPYVTVPNDSTNI